MYGLKTEPRKIFTPLKIKNEKKNLTKKMNKNNILKNACNSCR